MDERFHKQDLLVVGARTNIAVDEAIDFDEPYALQDAMMRFDKENRKGAFNPWAIDYFVFRTGTFLDFPPFTPGRPGYDNFFIWKAITDGMVTIDASKALPALHQNHDYSYLPSGKQKDVFKTPGGIKNYENLHCPKGKPCGMVQGFPEWKTATLQNALTKAEPCKLNMVCFKYRGEDYTTSKRKIPGTKMSKHASKE